MSLCIHFLMTTTTWPLGRWRITVKLVVVLGSLGWICSADKVCWHLMTAKKKKREKKASGTNKTNKPSGLVSRLHLCLPSSSLLTGKETPHTLFVSLNISLTHKQPWTYIIASDCVWVMSYIQRVGRDKLLYQRCHVCVLFGSFCSCLRMKWRKKSKILTNPL